MAGKKNQRAFFCSDCGHETVRWLGQCPGCGAWNTLAEAPTESRSRKAHSGAAGWLGVSNGRPVVLQDVDEANEERISAGIPEFDYVLGGGIIRGSFVLLGGPPGVGKSTILKQVAARLNAEGEKVLYVSGEESAAQVKIRARRLGEEALRVAFLSETEVGAILRQAEEFSPTVLVIDSIQTLYSEAVEGAPGNATQIRHTAAELLRYAKARSIAVFIVGHVTKDGNLAGPRLLEHMVDTVIYFEHTGDVEHRIMRAVKNRYGSVDEIGVFRMTESGLVPVENPSAVFLADRSANTPGSAVTAVVEGTRPLLVEVQGLASVASYGSPQRVATGFSRKRLAILLAVLEKRARIPFGQLDVFLNVVGGINLTEPAADAAVVAALVSSVVDRPLPDGVAFIGEVGLGGEMRRVAQIERRLAEVASMGFTKVFTASKSAGVRTPTGLEVIGVSNVGELIREAIGPLDGLRQNSGSPGAPRRPAKEKRERGGRRVALAID